MRAEPVEPDDVDDAPPSKRKAAVLAAIEHAIDGGWKPDLYRCKGCSITVDDRSRAGHLLRCEKRTPGSTVDNAFEPRPRPNTEEQARRVLSAQTKRRKRKPRAENPAAPMPVLDEPWDPWATSETPAPTPPPSKEQSMSTATMTTPEVASLLDTSAANVRALVKSKKLKPVTKGGPGVAATFDRADALRLKAERDAGASKPLPKRKESTALQKVRRAKAPELEAVVVETSAEAMVEDLVALIRCVARGWVPAPRAEAIVRQVAEQR